MFCRFWSVAQAIRRFFTAQLLSILIQCVSCSNFSQFNLSFVCIVNLSLNCIFGLKSNKCLPDSASSHFLCRFTNPNIFVPFLCLHCCYLSMFFHILCLLGLFLLLTCPPFHFQVCSVNSQRYIQFFTLFLSLSAPVDTLLPSLSVCIYLSPIPISKSYCRLTIR